VKLSNQAKCIAERVRFELDEISHEERDSDVLARKQLLIARYSQHSLVISNLVTPALESHLCKALDRVGVARESVSAYIFSSPEIQALSITLDDESCLIGISSGLINLLEGEELQFVVGHEVGHYLCRHRGYNPTHGLSNIGEFYLSRNQEISADRIGAVAAGSPEPCIRALIKTCSGLSSNHLRFDAGAYLRQLTSASEVGIGEDDTFSTHPSIAVRGRALMYFTLELAELLATEDLALVDKIRHRMDRRVTADLERISEPGRVAAIKTAEETLEFWIRARAIVDRGRFSREDQELVAQRFGRASCEKLKSLFQSTNASDLPGEVAYFLDRAKKDLQSLSPRDYQEREDRIQNSVLQYRQS
jgi:hypothetical protein